MKTKEKEQTLYYVILNYLKQCEGASLKEMAYDTGKSERSLEGELKRLMAVKGFGSNIIYNEATRRYQMSKNMKRVPIDTIVKTMKHAYYVDPDRGKYTGSYGRATNPHELDSTQEKI